MSPNLVPIWNPTQFGTKIDGNVCPQYSILLSQIPFCLFKLHAWRDLFKCFPMWKKNVICEHKYESNNIVDPLAKRFTFIKTKYHFYTKMINSFYLKYIILPKYNEFYYSIYVKVIINNIICLIFLINNK